MKLRILTLALCFSLLTAQAFASGFGVFTQGASGLGQANAVVAHPTGPSSLYFNPALLNDIPGRQIEIGTTAIFTERSIKLDSGQNEDAVDVENFPSTLYYTHQANEKFAAGIGLFFPFGLSSEWHKDYEGRYIGTYVDMFSMNINPAVSWRVNTKLSLAAGLDFVYVDTELRSMLPGFTSDVEQKFTGDGWGQGFNLGALYKITDRVSLGAAYRSKINVDVEGNLDFSGEDPLLDLLSNGSAESKTKLPAQFVAGVATKVTNDLTVEIGVRWEDWDVNDIQTLDLQYPRLGAPAISIDRDWHSTWSYNIGGHYRLNETAAINAGYLYGENAVPDATFEPLIPDTDAHLFTLGTDLSFNSWTLSGALGYEYHEKRDKKNELGAPYGTANGEYATDIYLFGLSLGYEF